MSGASRAKQFAGFHERWEPHVRRVARAILTCEADAEDVTQVIFSRLWATGRWKDLATPDAYLQQAARLEALKLARRHGRVLSLPDGDASMVPARAPDAAVRLIREESWRHVELLLSELPESLGETMTLTILKGLSRREAAEQMGCSLDALEKRITRAYRAIRDGADLPELHEALSTLADGGVGLPRAPIE